MSKSIIGLRATLRLLSEASGAIALAQSRYIRNADITPNKGYIRSTAYMNELSEMPKPTLENIVKVEKEVY